VIHERRSEALKSRHSCLRLLWRNRDRGTVAGGLGGLVGQRRRPSSHRTSTSGLLVSSTRSSLDLRTSSSSLQRRARRWFRRLPSGESGSVDARVEPALSARVRADVLGGGGSRFRSSLARQSGRGATRRRGTRLRSGCRARGGSRAACRARSGRRARRTPRGRARRPKTAARARRRTSRSRRGR
jgi:hypothetical protein